ncbi:MAG: hypothetical protein JWL86_1610 [Rhizobium sp.]|nr:hypothetical protein [Rhizobium sp.]
MSTVASPVPEDDTLIGGRRLTIFHGYTPKVILLILLLGLAVLPAFFFLAMASLHNFEADGAYRDLTFSHF